MHVLQFQAEYFGRNGNPACSVIGLYSKDYFLFNAVYLTVHLAM